MAGNAADARLVDKYSPEALAEICNGCSGGVSWIYGHLLRREVPFLYCCDEHDLAYEEGGGSRDRALADKRFRQCVVDSGRPVRAWLFWAAVRLGGWIFWKNSAEM